AALFAAFFTFKLLGLDPYVALFLLAPLFFVLGYGLQRFVIGPASHGDDRNMLLVTLGIAVIIENALLYNFRGDTRTIDVPYAFQTFNLGVTYLAVPRVVGFVAVFVVALALWLPMTFSLGTACVAIAACLLIPTYYVNPGVGNAFVLVAFTIVVLGGMGSVPGAVIGAFVIGVVESLSGLFLGESLGQIGIFLIFIVVLLLRPTGLFGARA